MKSGKEKNVSPKREDGRIKIENSLKKKNRPWSDVDCFFLLCFVFWSGCRENHASKHKIVCSWTSKFSIRNDITACFSSSLHVCMSTIQQGWNKHLNECWVYMMFMQCIFLTFALFLLSNCREDLAAVTGRPCACRPPSSADCCQKLANFTGLSDLLLLTNLEQEFLCHMDFFHHGLSLMDSCCFLRS